MKTFIGGFFTEYLNGIYKPSMNRGLAFLIVAALLFVLIWCVIHKLPIPDATITYFLGFIAILLGLSWNAKSIDIKSTTANPNLPDPNSKPNN